MGSQCELKFLKTIWQNIKSVKRILMFDKTRIYEDLAYAIPGAIDETCVELKRLIEHPELLPEGIDRFLELVEKGLVHLLETAQLETKSEDYEKVIKKHYKRILPNYDENRTNWQQFLHNKAPGTGFSKEQMHQHGTTQMVTAACQLLLRNKTQEYNQCARQGQKVSVRCFVSIFV